MEASASLGWRRRLAVILSVVLVVSVGARMRIDSDREAREAAEPKQSSVPQETSVTTLTPQGAEIEPETTPTAEPEEPSGMERALPFVTEGVLAMLLGLAAGIATRMVLKLVVVAMLVLFLGAQFLAYKGLLTVDWGNFWMWTRDSVLNISEQADVASLVRHKLPAVGAFLIGCILGLKRG